MLNNTILWAVNNRYLVLIAVIILMVASIFSVQKINLDAFPDVTSTQVVVNTEAPGLAAQEVEQLITFPIEAVMYALPDVEEVRSISKTGLSGVTVVFNEGVDIYFARQLVFERLQDAKELIPTGAGTPKMGPNTSGLGQVFQYLLVSEEGAGFDKMALRSLNDWLVKLLLMPVDGVTDVLSFGGEVRQYQVNLNPKKLLAYQLSQSDVNTALDENNVNAGGWYINRGQEQLVIRGAGWYASGEQGIAQIEQVPVKVVDGTVITIADVASVGFGTEIRQGAVTMTRRDSSGDMRAMGEVVSGIVLKRSGANSKDTIDAIHQRLDYIQQALPKGVKLIPFYDQADLVEQAVTTVVKALGLAFVFITFILSLFLLNIRATLLVLISIPLSIGLAMMTMTWMGVSANLMSLGGVAIAIGMLVDGSVVMIENIVRKLNIRAGKAKENQESITTLVSNAAQEVARSIFFASLVILIVFLPLFSFEGVEAKMFEPMATSIMLAIVFAIIVALMIVPALACIAYRLNFKPRTHQLFTRLETVYRASLLGVMSSKRVLLAALVVLIGLSAFLASKIGTEFMPELEEGTINLRVTLASSASLDTALSVAPKIEERLLAFPEVTYALSRIGRAEIGGDPEPVNNIEIYIGLKPIEQWQSAHSRTELQALMKEKLEVFPGVLLNFSQPIATRVDELLSGVKAQLAIKLFGPDLEVLAAKGAELERAISQVEGTTDVAMEQITGEAQLLITPKRQALSRYGLSVSDVMSIINDGVGGKRGGQIVNGNERYDIYIRLESQFRKNAQAIAEMTLLSPQGEWIRLGDVANIELSSGAVQIRRDDVQRRVVIQANVQGQDMGSVVANVRQQIASKVDLPAGYTVSIGGQFESQQRAQHRLQVIVPLSILLIALMLFLAFNSVRQVVLILINIPLAIAGGIIALYFSGLYLSVASSVGFITLFGVAILNGVVMIESINARCNSQKQLLAVLDGATSRLRPVLMTATTSALGLIPMILSQGVGAELQKPIAIVVVGGLVSSTLLTLFVLPSFYPVFTPKRGCDKSELN
ncbi:CusA/CzcA family heavy metal efflux RND transporter [Pseudoalteromonas sp. Of7M-16]|uniref:efflux RND transporter permease subunit n=1 Tax=Pseudoalteromonas sp. Of7M-16 TaxID=2917756 RepID=UPI001EF5C020|nr:CusA/CzcA family heavy metal efflux RND transporter [Pseudoalteromonas sp. Of7M-16]MCG7548675.1 CusA/CzcA family heavy metal efflux RND transporter [Pseudoalteromonas sp. Of7M-16]